MPIGRLGFLVLAVTVAACGPNERIGDRLPELLVTRSTTFGDEAGEGVLSTVWGVAVSEDGHVFLSEPPFARVVEFNPDGTFSRVVGARGDGPGEFRVPGVLSWRGDSLAVTDFQRGIHLFSPDGEFADLISFRINDGSSFGLRPVFPLADGSVLAWGPAGNSEIIEGTVTHETWLRMSRDGVVIDTLVVASVEGRLFSVRYQDGGWSGAHPFSWAPLRAAPPHRHLTCRGRPTLRHPWWERHLSGATSGTRWGYSQRYESCLRSDPCSRLANRLHRLRNGPGQGRETERYGSCFGCSDRRPNRLARLPTSSNGGPVRKRWLGMVAP